MNRMSLSLYLSTRFYRRVIWSGVKGEVGEVEEGRRDLLLGAVEEGVEEGLRDE